MWGTSSRVSISLDMQCRTWMLYWSCFVEILSIICIYCWSLFYYNGFRTACCSWSHGLRPKKLSVSVAVPPAPVRVPSQRPLAPSVSSVKSVANDKGDNEMILGAVHRSWGLWEIVPCWGNVPLEIVCWTLQWLSSMI